MDISFHYYAVKATAILCGVAPNDAEIIATYSQFVDDFNIAKELKLEGIPDYCRALVKDDKFCPVQTGFGMIEASKPSIQKRVIMPFHFIPEGIFIDESYETKPAIYQSNCLIDVLLQAPINFYRGDPSIDNLIAIGIATHTFADTYAHADFNAFDSDANSGKNIQIEHADGTSRKPVPPLSPPIGHAHAWTVPDESDLCFQYKFKKKEKTITRTNWVYFADCAVELGKYFCFMVGNFWSDGLETRIRTAITEGCKIDYSKSTISQMQTHWQHVDGALQTTTFAYHNPLDSMLSFVKETIPNGMNKKELLELFRSENENDEESQTKQEIIKQLKATATTEFYLYNFTCYNHRLAVIGE